MWSKCRCRSYDLYRSSQNRLEHKSRLAEPASATKVVVQQAVIFIRNLPGFFRSLNQLTKQDGPHNRFLFYIDELRGSSLARAAAIEYKRYRPVV